MDFDAKIRILLLTCCLAVPAVQADSGLLVTFPKFALYDSTLKVCFTSLGLEGERTINVSAEITLTPLSGERQPRTCLTKSNGERWTGTETDACLDVQVTCQDQGNNSNVPVSLLLRLLVNGRTTSGDGFRKTYDKVISVRRQTRKTFIQTDKPIYQPGQKVLFRCLTVTYPDMVPDTESVWRVTVSSPSGTRLQQWRNLASPNGLVDLDFQLSSEPELGTWRIEARDQSGTVTAQPFSVEEYVLPKFEVQITPPLYLHKGYEGDVMIKVCAKYTYGQPVRGRISANVSVNPETQSRWYMPRPIIPVEVVANDSTGCADINIHSSRLKLNAVRYVTTGARYATSNLRLNVRTNFTESGTGVSLAASSSTEVASFDYKLELRAPNTFKPGLPYRGEVVVTRPDSTPVSGHDVMVWVEGEPQTVTTGPNGVADFTYTAPYDPFSTTMTVRTRFLDDNNYISAYGIRSWYSPSSSFLDALTTVTRVTPGQSVPVNLTFTLPRVENVSEVQFFYRVVSSGRIVTSGQHVCAWGEAEIPLTGGVALEIEVRAEYGAPTSGLQGRASGRAQRMSASGRSQGRKKRQWHHHGRPIDPWSRTERTAPDLSPYKSVDVKQCQLFINATPSMSPTSQVLVYYIRSDGEVVSATTKFTMAPYFENQVSVEFLEGREVRPGHPVSIAVTAQPSSLCAIGVVDKSVHIMGGDNQLTKAKVFAPMTDLNVISGSLNRTCPTVANNGTIRATTQHVDSAEAFRKSGLSVATDFGIETRPCWITERRRCRGWDCHLVVSFQHGPITRKGKIGPPPPVMDMIPERVPMMNMNFQVSADVHVQEEMQLDEEPQPLVELRSYFPETWLWKLAPVGLDGRHITTEDIPHTITDWVASAFCLSSDRGVGVAESASVRAFQPFFLSYTLPYSVIRGEKVPVKVTVFNYLTTCLNIELSLSESTNYFVEARPESEIVEVCGNSAETLVYEIVPIELGEIPIRVDAIAQSSALRGDIPNNVLDAIQDTIIVEPEGAEREETFSELICPADDEDGLYLARVPLRLPSLVVPGSARGRIQVIGDIMGPVMSNLDSLLRMPFGCGEQNMIFMAPNIFVMQYLSSSGQLTTSIQEKALEFMRQGYQRELTYQLRDASYSAFGESDGEGSTWLTAFVLRCFAQAQDFMDIDEANLARTRHWLARNRRDAMGCVLKRGRVIHKEMQGAVSSPVTLTAFVTSALLEAGASPWDESVTAGLDCIQHWMDNTEETEMDTYTLAISSYALGLAHAYDTQADCIYYLENRMQGDLRVSYWSNSDVSETEETLCSDHCHAPSSDIEVTSYALLGYLNQDPDREFNAVLMETMPIVKWLNSQRNGFGGFSSTQDTVVGLQALAQFAEVVYDPDSLLALNISVDATRTPPAEAQVRNFTVGNDNRLILQREDLAEVPTELTVTATGAGCALFQAELRYNVPVLLPNRLLFDIRVSVEDADSNALPNPAVCGDKKVTICIRYTGSGEETNMAVIEMKMVSGYIPHEDSLELMQSEIGAGIGLKRIDKYEKGKPLALYFDQFDDTTRCMPIQLKQEIVVKETKDAVIKVYDYYKPGVVGFKRYNTCEDQQ